VGLKEVKEKIAIIRKELEEVFKEEAKGLFETVPTLGTVVWEQYAPYFNDGDPCVFSVRDSLFTSLPEDSELLLTTAYGDLDLDLDDMKDVVERENLDYFWKVSYGAQTHYWKTEEGHWQIGQEKTWPSRELPSLPEGRELIPESQIEAMKDFSKLICDSDLSSVMENIFGSDCQVKLHRGGFSVGEHSHD
jgi:hypothetical protein